PFKRIFDLVRRVNLRAANKKAFENLAYGGSFDSFTNMHRAHCFTPEKDGGTFLEKILRYGNSYQESLNSAQHSLFGESTGTEIPEPTIPAAEPWHTLVRLKFERDVIGVYVSGHPLDLYKLEMNSLIKN